MSTSEEKPAPQRIREHPEEGEPCTWPQHLAIDFSNQVDEVAHEAGHRELLDWPLDSRER